MEAGSTLDKTIQILRSLSEQQLDMIYSYAQFINSRPVMERRPRTESTEKIVNRLAGLIPDEGKSMGTQNR